jgi:hypothetical protein
LVPPKPSLARPYHQTHPRLSWITFPLSYIMGVCGWAGGNVTEKTGYESGHVLYNNNWDSMASTHGKKNT